MDFNITNNKRNDFIKNASYGTAAVIAGWEGQTYLNRGMKYFLLKSVYKKSAQYNGGGYKEYLNIALKQNNLENDLTVIDLNANTKDDVEKMLGFRQDRKTNFRVKKSDVIKRNVKAHIMRTISNPRASFDETLKGNISIFNPRRSLILCNFDKNGAALFHEIAHKLNKESENFCIRTLSKIRTPFAIYGGLGVSACAMLTNKKKENEKENLNDVIKNNCGTLTVLTMLPLTLEETIANIRGSNIAKKAGVFGEKLLKVQNGNKLSIASYWINAFIAGIAAWGGNKIRDYIYDLKI